MRRWIIGSVAVVAVVAGIAFVAGGGLGPGAGPGATQTPLPPVPPANRVVAEARVVPADAATVTTPVPGSVARVAAAEGDRVAAGAVLVELDDAAARAEVAAARAGLDAFEARRDQADAVVAQAAAEVDRATEAWRAARAVRDQLPDNASAARERQADAEVAAALAGLDSAKAARDGATAAASAARAEVARAEASVDAADAALARLTIRAPIAGTIAQVTIVAGDAAAAGVPLVRIAGDGGWTFETTDLTQDEVASIAVGAAASVTVDGFPEPIAGRVMRIAAFGQDRQGDIVFTAVIAPTNGVPDGVRWNMLASVEIATGP